MELKHGECYIIAALLQNSILTITLCSAKELEKYLQVQWTA